MRAVRQSDHARAVAGVHCHLESYRHQSRHQSIRAGLQDHAWPLRPLRQPFNECPHPRIMPINPTGEKLEPLVPKGNLLLCGEGCDGGGQRFCATSPIFFRRELFRPAPKKGSSKKHRDAGRRHQSKISSDCCDGWRPDRQGPKRRRQARTVQASPPA